MSTIKLKHSTTATAVPTTGDLVAGELALNIADGIIFFENAAADSVFSFNVSGNYAVTDADNIFTVNQTLRSSGVKGTNADTALNFQDNAGVDLLKFGIEGLPVLTGTVPTDYVAYWSMDNADITGTTLYDATANNVDATLENIPTTGVAGQINEAIQFDGVVDRIALPNNANIKPTNVSVACWINTGTLGAYSAIFSTFQLRTTYSGYMLRADNKKATFLIASNTGTTLGTDFNTASGGVDLDDGNWHFLVGTYDGSTIRTYVDGTEVGNTAYAGGLAYGTANYYIGASHDSAVGSVQHWNGIIDVPRVFNRALTATEVQDMFYDEGGAGATLTDDVVLRNFDGDILIQARRDDLVSSYTKIFTHVNGSAVEQVSIGNNVAAFSATITGDGAVPTGGTAGQVLKKVDGTNYNVQWADASGGAGGLSNWTRISGNYTATAGDKLAVDTSGGAVTVTLPASASAGDIIQFIDNADLSVYNLTIAKNGHKIQSIDEDVTVDSSNALFWLQYVDTTIGWDVFGIVGGAGSCGGGGGVPPVPSIDGLKFPATQVEDADVNTLDDYEEGTWTPIITDGTNDATHTIQNGQYTKVGNQVSITAYVTTSSIGSVSGNIRLKGLPFVSSGGNNFGGISVSFAVAMSLGAAGRTVTGNIPPSLSEIYLRLWDDATGVTQLQATEWSTGSAVIHGIYFV